MSRLPPIQLRISFADCSDTEWVAVGLHLVEALDQLYEASIEIETADLQADTAELLGSSCELCMQRGELPPRHVYGVVARVEYLGHGDHHVRARVTVVPAFALAKQRINSRIWQDASVQDIVREVLATSLDEYGRSVELGHLARGVAPRDYCVQYRERDFDFVCRLLEESGISWFFTHDDERGHEVLTLCDDNQDYPRFANVDNSATLPIIAHSPDEADVESLQVFEWARALTPTTVALSGYDPASPGAVAVEQHGEPDARGRVRRVYEHGQRRHAAAEIGVRMADLEQALRMSGSFATCESNASLARVGHVFTLDGVTHEGTPSEWIVISVAHHYGAAGEGVGEGVYRNTLGCVPATVVLRPLEHTPKPEVHGPQTATVVGGGEIDVDAQGRIAVQFHWQEQPSFAAGASCRVRCAQSWAGPGFGAQFIPRVGMEVVVEFLEGNPDRPLVTGCVYNGLPGANGGNEPPFALPGNSTQSGWRSNSSPGGGGSNELRFEDAAGLEQIYVHGQKDWVADIRNDASTHVGRNQVLGVGHDRDTTIQHDRREQIGHDQVVAIGHDHSESVGAAMRLQVGSDHTVTVGADQDITVGHSRSESIGANATQLVAQCKTVTVGGALATIVGGAMNTSVGAASIEEVGGVKSIAVGAASSESVVGSKSVEASSISHSARKDMSLSSGANTSVQIGKALQVDVDGALALHGKKSGLIECDVDLTIKVGKASITLKKDGTIVLDGVEITVKGKQAITLKAKKVNQN
jgi:type VI secretion system secreted protein VgrG